MNKNTDVFVNVTFDLVFIFREYYLDTGGIQILYLSFDDVAHKWDKQTNGRYY